MEAHGFPFVSSSSTVSSKWFVCCQNGSLDQVREVLEEVQGRILNSRHYVNGKTGLVVAAQNGHLDVVKFLVEAGARLEIADNRGCTALLRAASEGRVDVMRYLLHRRAVKDAVDENGLNMVHYAVVAGSTQALALALKVGLSVNSKDVLKYTPIMHAVRTGPSEAVTRMLLAKGADCSEVLPNSGGYTPLIMACRTGRSHTEIELLLKWGAWLQERDQNGMTPFLSAVDAQCMDLVRYFVERGCSPYEERDYKNRNALAIAMQNLDMDMVHLIMSGAPKPRRVLPVAGKTARRRIMMTNREWKALLREQAEERRRLERETEEEREARKRAEKARHVVADLKSPRALRERAERLHPDTAQLERPLSRGKRKKELWKQEEERRVEAAAEAEEELEALRARRAVADALVAACRLNEPAEVLRALLDGADPNVRGYRPVHHAALRGNPASLRFLFLAGADLEAATSLGFRALHIAALRGHCDFAMRLLEYGADGTAPTNEPGGVARAAPQLADSPEFATRLVAAIERQSFVRGHPHAAAAHRPAPPMLLVRSGGGVTFAWPPLLLDPPVARTPADREALRRAAVRRSERHRVRTTPWLWWGDPERWRGAGGRARLFAARAGSFQAPAPYAHAAAAPFKRAHIPVVILRYAACRRRRRRRCRRRGAELRSQAPPVGRSMGRSELGRGAERAVVDTSGHVVAVEGAVDARALAAAGAARVRRVATAPWGDRDGGAAPEGGDALTCAPFHVWCGPELQAWQVQFSVRRRGPQRGWGGLGGVRVMHSVTLEEALREAERALEVEAFVLRERWHWVERRRAWRRRPAFKPRAGQPLRCEPGALRLLAPGSAGFRLVLGSLLGAADDALATGSARDPGWWGMSAPATVDTPRGSRFAVRAALGFRPCWDPAAPSRTPRQLRVYRGPAPPRPHTQRGEEAVAAERAERAAQAAQVAQREAETAPWRMARVRALNKLATVARLKQAAQAAGESGEARREWERFKAALPGRLRPAPPLPQAPESVLSVATPPPVAHVLCELTLRVYDRTGVVLPLPCDLFAAFDADCGLSLDDDPPPPADAARAEGAPFSRGARGHRETCSPPLLLTHTVCRQEAVELAASALRSGEPLAARLASRGDDRPRSRGHTRADRASTPRLRTLAALPRAPNAHAHLPYALATAARMRARAAASVDSVLHAEGRELAAVRAGTLAPAADGDEMRALSCLATGARIEPGDWVRARVRGWTGQCWTQWSEPTEWFQLDDERMRFGSDAGHDAEGGAAAGAAVDPFERKPIYV